MADKNNTVSFSQELFGKANDFQDWQKLMLLFFDNKIVLPMHRVLFQQPGNDNIDPKYKSVLKTINSSGLITINSQEGEKGNIYWQRINKFATHDDYAGKF